MKKILFILFHSLFDIRFYPLLLFIKNNNKKPYSYLKKQQEIKLRKLIEYVYKYIPYYKELFDQNKIKPSDIKKISDLQKIPILTKKIINKNINKFKPQKKFIKYLHYFNNSTGGTTGTPLIYKISRKNRLISGILKYRAWLNAGYKMGDKVIIFAGSSLITNNKSLIETITTKIFRNTIKLSSFEMSNSTINSYIKIINNFKPKLIYGYPSSLFFLSNWIVKNKQKIHSPLAIFTTSENLYPYMRKKIEKTLNCKIFDAYGLHDGGITTHECIKHQGMHIDTERSILEVIDKRNNQIKEGNGKILATDLDNYIFPFIRYDTGDIGQITHKKCNCGITTPRITKILGRSVDILITPEGKKIHRWFFLYIFWKYCKGIEKYQIIQEKINQINIKIVKNKNFDKTQIKKIKEIIKEKSKKWKIKFIFVKKIKPTKSGKYKFIISKI